MPIYEYVCQTCGSDVEVLHGLNEPGPGVCDICGGPMRKRIASPAIVFRGSGWAKKERRDAASAGGNDKEKDKGPDKGTDKPKGDGAEPKGDGTEPKRDTAPAREGGPGTQSRRGSGEGPSAASPSKEANAG